MPNPKLIKRADGTYSERGLWDNIRANRGSGKKPTDAMLEQEAEINKSYKKGGKMKAKKTKTHEMVKAPSGYHWMTEKGRHYLMAHEGNLVPHKGAGLEAKFRIKTKH